MIIEITVENSLFEPLFSSNIPIEITLKLCYNLGIHIRYTEGAKNG